MKILTVNSWKDEKKKKRPGMAHLKTLKWYKRFVRSEIKIKIKSPAWNSNPQLLDRGSCPGHCWTGCTWLDDVIGELQLERA